MSDEAPFPSLDLHQLLLRLVGPERVCCADAEGAEHARDYAPLLRALDAIAGGGLGIGEIRFREGPKRLVVFSREGAPEVELILAGNTSRIDADFLVQQLNAVMDADGRAERFCWFSSRSFDREIGFAFVPQRVAAQLVEQVAARREHGFYEAIFPDGARRATRP